MFNDSAFAGKYRKYKKVHSLQIGEWVPSLHSPDQKARKLDYKVDLGAIGTVKTVEDQVSNSFVPIIVEPWFLEIAIYGHYFD